MLFMSAPSQIERPAGGHDRVVTETPETLFMQCAYCTHSVVARKDFDIVSADLTCALRPIPCGSSCPCLASNSLDAFRDLSRARFRRESLIRSPSSAKTLKSNYFFQCFSKMIVIRFPCSIALGCNSYSTNPYCYSTVTNEEPPYFPTDSSAGVVAGIAILISFY